MFSRRRALKPHRLTANYTRESEQALNQEVDYEDSADGSSIDASVVGGECERESDGEEDAPSDKEGEEELGGPDEYKDPDEYGERLVNEEGGQEGVAGIEKVSYYAGRRN
jgi:hypothetical protein